MKKVTCRMTLKCQKKAIYMNEHIITRNGMVIHRSIAVCKKCNQLAIDNHDGIVSVYKSDGWIPGQGGYSGFVNRTYTE